METKFLPPNGETLKRMIQEYVQTSESTVFESQIVEQMALISEFAMHLSHFYEQENTHFRKIINAEQNYQMLLQELDAVRKHMVDQKNLLLGPLKQLCDEFSEALNGMEERHMKQYVAAHAIVCKDAQKKFEKLFSMKQHEMAELKKKIFSLLI